MVVMNTDRQVLTWDIVHQGRDSKPSLAPLSQLPEDRLYTDFEQAYPYQGMCLCMCVICKFMHD